MKRTRVQHVISSWPWQKGLLEITCCTLVTCYFKLAMAKGADIIELDQVVSARAKGNWFDLSKLNNLVIMIVFSTLVLFFISHARRHPGMFLRKISGLDAADEGLGRATDMGKPVLFVHGLTPIGSISTLAAI